MCAEALSKQEEVVEKQIKVIKTQDELIKEQEGEINRLEDREDTVTWSMGSIIGALALILLL